jgi:hypothetical protein
MTETGKIIMGTENKKLTIETCTFVNQASGPRVNLYNGGSHDEKFKSKFSCFCSHVNFKLEFWSKVCKARLLNTDYRCFFVSTREKTYTPMHYEHHSKLLFAICIHYLFLKRFIFWDITPCSLMEHVARAEE